MFGVYRSACKRKSAPALRTTLFVVVPKGAYNADRCATRLPRKNLREFFQSNTLEEYSHCDDYFFIEHPDLNTEDVYRSVQLPSILNFDQQMYRMAEEDWLGHLLVSLFQESSIKFYQECKEFYRQL